MKLSRIPSLMKIVLFGHILNWPWRDKMTRRRYRTMITANVVSGYFKRYLYAVKNIQHVPVIRDDENEKVWSIWGWTPRPDAVCACFRQIEKKSTREHIVLDENTLFDAIQLPDYIMAKRANGQIGNAHFADICRIEILYRYGGYWMDGTNFMTSDFPQWIVDADFFVFLTNGNLGSPYSFIQNCFIRARRGSYLLAAWRAMIFEFWKNEPREFDYFMHQIMFRTLVENDPRAADEFAKMPHVCQDPTHRLWRDYKFKPFDKNMYDKITRDTFFQKITHNGLENRPTGCFADVMMEM